MAVDVIPKNPTKFTKRARDKYLETLCETGNLATAAAAAVISSSYVYQRLKIDEELAADHEAAMDVYRSRIEAEIKRRAIEGVVEKKYHQGEAVLEPELDEDGVPIYEPLVDKDGNQIFDKFGRPCMRPKTKGHAFVRHYSDSLLLAHARRHIPEYNEKKSVEMKVSGLEGLLGEIKGSQGLPSGEEDIPG